MKPAAQALVDLLASNNFWIADLYTLTLGSGAVHRFTSADRDLIEDGALFSAGQLKFARETVRVVTGLEVDELRVTILADGSTMLGAQPFLKFVHSGGLDRARLALERAFMPEFGDTSRGAVPLFAGRIAEASVRRTAVELAVKSDLELLNVKLPRNLYQPICLHTVYDAGCGLARANFRSTATIQVNSTASLLRCDLTQPDGYFALGTVRFTSGIHSGTTRTIKAHAPGSLTLALPLHSPPAVGDAFEAFPGCDRMQATCVAKFDNLANFRGFPYIPLPETAR